MFRSPKLLTSAGRKGTHISLLLPKEALLSVSPVHQKWNETERKGLCFRIKGKEYGGKLPQDPLTNQETILGKTQGPSVSLSPPLPNERHERFTPRAQCSKPTVNTHFVCSEQPQSSLWRVPPYDHCQPNRSPKYSVGPGTLCRSDLKCLSLHSRSQDGLQKASIAAHNADSQQRFSTSVYTPHGPQQPPFPQSYPWATKLWSHSPAPAGGSLPPPQLWAHLCSASFHSAARLKVSPEYCLSAENEARCRKRLEKNGALYQKEKGKSWAAVLVSLCTVGGEPGFLFTLRSSKLKGRHKGDVSFAGGKKDPVDLDVVATALREAQEELGVTVTTDQVWGVMKPLRDMSGMLIAPVLANLGPLEPLSFRPNPSEVEEIFTLTLAHVCSPENQGYTNFRTGNKYGYTLPVFRNGKHRVWGLTAVALDHTLKLIVPS